MIIITDEDGSQSISVNLRCASVGAIEDMQSLLADSETINSVNQIAQAISESLDEKICINTSLEVGGIHGIYNDPLMTVITSEWSDVALLPATMEQRHAQYAHLKHLQDIVQDIDHRHEHEWDMEQTCMTPPLTYTRPLTRSRSLASVFKCDTSIDAMTTIKLTKYMVETCGLDVQIRPKQKIVDWNDYAFPKRINNTNGGSGISSSTFGSFASLASLESLTVDRETKRYTIG